MSTATYDEAVHAWAGHLRDGGTLDWEEFLAAGADARPWDGPRPAAPQLVLLHRLTTSAHDLPLHDLAGLADVVLTSSGIGRGPVDIPLPYDGGPAFGTPAVAPADLPASELLRVATGALASVVSRLPGDIGPPRRARRVVWRGRFTVHGTPRSAAVVRRALLERGLAEGGSRARHLVLAGPFEAMMAEHWARLVREGGITNWPRTWRHAVANDKLPPGLEVGRLARELAARHGESRVNVVVATSPAEAVDLAAGLLGVKGASAFPADDATSVELWRRLNRVLDQSVGPARRRSLAAAVLPGLLAPQSTPDPLLAAPPEQVAWARGVGARLAEELKSGGYAVHGDPDLVVPQAGVGRRHRVDAGETLDLALVALTRAWRLREESTGGED